MAAMNMARIRCRQEYVDDVRRAGGIPVLIPPGESHTSELVAAGWLLLSGGPDVDPDHYDGLPHKMVYGIDPERDEMELALARLVVERDQPTLCICRGIQVMNVALGGTLIEHLPDIVGEQIPHRDPRNIWGVHAVHVDADTRLAAILENRRITSNSWDNQAIREVATPLTVSPAPQMARLRRLRKATIAG